MNYVTVRFGPDTKVFIETDAPIGPKPASTLGKQLAEKVKAELEKSMDGVKAMADIFSKLREDIPNGPKSFEVTFGLKFSAELSAFVVAKAGGEANYTVKLAWP